MEKISDFFKTNHSFLKLDSDNLFNIVPKALWYSEYPYAGADAFQFYLSEMSRSDRFIFWGQGVEEILYGRKDYIAIYMKEILNTFFSQKYIKYIKKILPRIHMKSKFHKLMKIILSTSPFETYVAFREVFTPEERIMLINGLAGGVNKGRILKPKYLESLNQLENYSYLTIFNGFFSDVMFCPQKELLNPYMDKDLINFAYRIPWRMKIKKNRPRYLLRKIMEGKLPDFTMQRSKGSWRTPDCIREKQHMLLYYINKLMKRFSVSCNAEEFLKKNQFNFDYKFWALFTLEIIMEIFVDNKNLQEPTNLGFMD